MNTTHSKKSFSQVSNSNCCYLRILFGPFKIMSQIRPSHTENIINSHQSNLHYHLSCVSYKRLETDKTSARIVRVQTGHLPSTFAALECVDCRPV